MPSHRTSPPRRTRLPKPRGCRVEGTFPGPTAAHLKALAHGMVALSAFLLFQLGAIRPRLFESTRAFLLRLNTHRATSGSHAVSECAGCQGIRVVLAFTQRCLQQAVERGDETTAQVLTETTRALTAAYAGTLLTELDLVHYVTLSPAEIQAPA